MTPSHLDDDPTWNAAREAGRAEVRAALAPRPRSCPLCGHVETGTGRTCSRCGGDLVARRTRRPRRRDLAILAVGVAAVGGVSAAIVPGLRDSAAREERTAAARQARLEAAERARLRVDMRPVLAQGPRRRPGEAALAHRARILGTAEAAITADARDRVARGTLDGPVRGTRCSPFPATDTRRRLEADLSIPRNRYQCIAYKRRFALPELEGRARTGVFGVPYWLVLDYGSGRMTFCKVTPRAGEGGRSLAVVQVPVPCRDPLRTG